jgi:hypothetical protein
MKPMLKREDMDVIQRIEHNVSLLPGDMDTLLRLSKLGKRMQFVSVGKGLPVNDQKVDIFLTRGGRVANTTYINEGGEFTSYLSDNDFDVCYELDEVTHWMPLPPNPGEGE